MSKFRMHQNGQIVALVIRCIFQFIKRKKSTGINLPGNWMIMLDTFNHENALIHQYCNLINDLLQRNCNVVSIYALHTKISIFHFYNRFRMTNPVTTSIIRLIFDCIISYNRSKARPIWNWKFIRRNANIYNAIA